MIIGHIGLAFATKRRWPRVPLGALLLATFAPDILRELFAAAGLSWRQTNFYSHSLPWSLVLAVAAGWLAWNALEDRTAGLVVGGVVMSHIVLDLVSGDKPLWRAHAVGLHVSSLAPFELFIEAGLLLAGWLLMRRTSPRRWVTHPAVPSLLIALQATYLFGTISQRPYRTRCLAYPIGACTDSSWLTQRWNTRPFW